MSLLLLSTVIRGLQYKTTYLDTQGTDRKDVVKLIKIAP